jgi:Biotin protein ligase C terminal domain
VRSGEEQTTGRCAGIAVDGALLLDTPEGRRAIYSGTLR